MLKRRLSKRLSALAIVAVGVTALSGCVVVPAHPADGYGYGPAYGYGYGYGYGRVVPPPVYVAPRPYYRGRGGGHRHGWR